MLLLALLLLVGAIVAFVVPPVGLGLLVFSGRYSIGRFETYLGEQSQVAAGDTLWIAPIILFILCVAVSARSRWRSESGGGAAMPQPAAALVFAFGVLLVVGCFYSPSEGYGARKALEYVFLTQAAFLAPIILANSARRYGLLLLTLFCVPLLFALLGLGLGARAGGWGVTRIAVLGGGPIVYSRFMVVGMLACLGLALTTKSRTLRCGLLVGFIMMFLAFLVAGSRGAVVGLGCAAVFLAFGAAVGRRAKEVRASALVSGLVAIAAVAVVVLALYQRLDLPHVQRYQHLWEELPGSTSVATREAYWQDAISMFVSRPVFGHGTGSFGAVAVGIESEAYPHNIILEVAAELGLVGLFLFVAFILVVMRSAIRLLTALGGADWDSWLWPYAVVTTTSFVFYLAAAQFSGDLYDSRFIWLFGGMILSLEALAGRGWAESSLARVPKSADWQGRQAAGTLR